MMTTIVLLVVIIIIGTLVALACSEQIPELAAESDNDEGVRRIKFGEKIKLDELGPIIVNKDCTLSRIETWDKMTKREQETAMRRL